jgi:hypothetical protein
MTLRWQPRRVPVFLRRKPERLVERPQHEETDNRLGSLGVEDPAEV